MEEQSEGEHVLTVRLVLCVWLYVYWTVVSAHHQCEVASFVQGCSCVSDFIAVCPPFVLQRYSGVVICANEWGRWSVHLARRKKAEVLGCVQWEVMREMGVRSRYLIGHASWNGNASFPLFDRLKEREGGRQLWLLGGVGQGEQEGGEERGEECQR